MPPIPGNKPFTRLANTVFASFHKQTQSPSGKRTIESKHFNSSAIQSGTLFLYVSHFIFRGVPIPLFHSIMILN